VASQDIEGILNIMYKDRIVDKKSLKISKEFKKLIEDS
jgi:hypothetical protein